MLSHQPDLKSGLPSQMDLILRKIAHVVEFGVLTWLMIRALRPDNRQLSKKIIVIAALTSLIYAILDEYHQSFILGRAGTVWDVGIDTIGIVIVLMAKLKFRD